MAAYNPMIGVAPDAIAKAVDRGIEIRATVSPEAMFVLRCCISS